METGYKISKIISFNTCTVGDWWKPTTSNGLNRLYYINGGNAWYIQNGQKIPFKKGMLYFIPYYANMNAYTDLDDPLDHTYMSFVLSPPVVSSNIYCLDPATSPYVNQAVKGFRALCQTRTLPNAETELLKSIVLYLIDTIVQSQPQSIIKDRTVLTALDMMHSTLSEKPTVSDIAQACNISTGGFIRKFTRYLGESPYSYLKNLKVCTALTLRAEGATLEEAALRCGYSDASALLHAISSVTKKKAGKKI